MTEKSNQFPMDPELPTRVAESFVGWMASRGVTLGFDRVSLERDFELALEKRFFRSNKPVLQIDEKRYDLETGAACFFGEALRQQYSGQWFGELGTNSGVNYYLVRIRFGDYVFNPFSWVGYRLTNGRRSEGTVEECLRAVTPSMKDRIDHKRNRIDSIIASGGVVVDSEIY